MRRTPAIATITVLMLLAGCASIIMPDGTKVTAVGTSTKITYSAGTNTVGAVSDVELPEDMLNR